MIEQKQGKEPTVTAKCVQCGHKREIKAGEVPEGMMPMCDRCLGVMIADSASASHG